MEIGGRVVLLTGASRGIGRALAEALADDGARLVLTARDGSRLRDLAERLAGRGAEVRTVAGDVGTDEDARRMAQAALDAFGRIDVLVNNAAVLLGRGPVRDLPPHEWEETLRVNVLGTVNLIRHVLPVMERQREGLIVNLSSGWGRVAEANVAPYCASKFAVEALTQSVAEEAGPGVVVFALNPGIIATEMLATAFASDVSVYPAPEDLTPRWRRLFASVSPAWHGTSRDL